MHKCKKMPTSATATINFSGATSLLGNTLSFTVKTGTTTIGTGTMVNPVAISDITEDVADLINASGLGYNATAGSETVVVTAPLGLGSSVNGLDIYITLNQFYELKETILLNTPSTGYNLYEMVEVGDFIFGIGAEDGNTTALTKAAIHQIDTTDETLITTVVLAGDGDTPASKPHAGWIEYSVDDDLIYAGGGNVTGKAQFYASTNADPTVEDTTVTLATDYLNTRTGRYFNSIMYLGNTSSCNLFKFNANPPTDLDELTGTATHCFPDLLGYDNTRDKIWYRGAASDSPQGWVVYDVGTNTSYDQVWSNFGTLVFRDVTYAEAVDCFYIVYEEDGDGKIMKLPATNTGVGIDKSSLPTGSLVYDLAGCATITSLKVGKLEANEHIIVSVNCASPRLVIIDMNDTAGNTFQVVEGITYAGIARHEADTTKFYVNKLTSSHSDVDVYELNGLSSFFGATFSGGSSTTDVNSSCENCKVVSIQWCQDDLLIEAGLTPLTSYVTTLTNDNNVNYTQTVETDGDGSFTLDLTLFPEGLFSPNRGMIYLEVSTEILGDPITMTIEGSDYTCVYILTKTINDAN